MNRNKFNPLAVGVTGGIGSGKTEVCNIFESFGGQVLFADALAKDLTNTDSEIKQKLAKEFGSDIFKSDGTLDRSRMAGLVFEDKSLKTKLDKIVHPHVLALLKKEISSFKRQANHPVLFVEAALLYEAGADEMLDYTIVVDAGEEERIKRLMRRDGTSRAHVLARMESQMPHEEKVKRADFVIQNSCTLHELRQKCRFFYKLLCTIGRASEVRK